MASLHDLEVLRNKYSCLCDETAMYEKFMVPYKAHGIFVWNIGDKVPFIDLVMGYSSLNFGHSNPDIIEIANKSLSEIIHIHSFNTEYKLLLSELLVENIESNEPFRVYYDIGGSSIVDSAIRIARLHTKKPKIVCFTGGFHGTSYMSSAVTDDEILNKTQYLFSNLSQDVIKIPYPDKRVVDSSEMILKELKRQILSKNDIAAVIMEPVLGAGGFIIPHESFFLKLRELTQLYNIVFISDEIQVGVGRLGYLFASTKFFYVPDIILLSKSLAGGIYPLSALICKSQLFNLFPQKGTSFQSTFSNSAFGTRIAFEVLKLAYSKTWFNNAILMGDYLLNQLNFIKNYDFTSEIRGIGMALAFDICSPEKNYKFPEDQMLKMFIEICLKNKLLVYRSGRNRNIIKLAPPINISYIECDMIVERIKLCLEEFNDILR